MSFPGVEERSSYGSPAVFIGKQLFAQVPSHKYDAVMLRTDSLEERDHLIEADPETFFITGHFKSYKGLLARLDKLDASTLRALLERRWQAIAPKTLRESIAAAKAAKKR